MLRVLLLVLTDGLTKTLRNDPQYACNHCTLKEGPLFIEILRFEGGGARAADST